MKNLDYYTLDICCKLRQIAENREWKSWRELDQDALRLDLELNYHLHIAAEANGQRCGMPPMPPFPLQLSLENPDPAVFLQSFSTRIQ